MQTRFGSDQLQDKSKIIYDADTLSLAKGQPIYLSDGATDYFLLADGKYQTMTNCQFTIEDGKLKSIDQANHSTCRYFWSTAPGIW